MPGLPTIQLQVENAAGTLVDVTRSLRRSAGYSITRGKSDRFSAVEASKLEFTVRNDDGKFTPLIGSLGLRLGRRVRLTHTVTGGTGGTTTLVADPAHPGYYLTTGVVADGSHPGYFTTAGLVPDPAHSGYYLTSIAGGGVVTSRRFTGYIGPSPTSWNGPGGAYLRITAYDKRPDMARAPLRQAIEEEFLTASPIRLYPLSEPAGAAQGVSLVGTPPALVPTPGPTTPVFGVATGIGGEGVTSCVLTNAPDRTARPLVASSSSTLSFPNGFTVAMVVTTGYSDVDLLSLGGAGAGQVAYRFRLDPVDGVVWQKTDGGTVLFGGCRSQGGTATADGNPHLLVATSNGTTSRLFVDGVLVDTSTETATSSTMPDRLAVGPFTSGFTSTFAAGQVALFDRVLAGSVVALLAKVAGASPVETSDARAARFGRYIGLLNSDILTETGAVTALAPQPTRGLNVVDLLAQVDAAEGGLTYLNASGQLVFQNRRHRAALTAPSVTLSADDLGEDPQVAYDWEGVENTASGSRVGSTSTVTAQNNASVKDHDQYPADDPNLSSLLVTTDAAVTDIVSWRANRYTEPAPRLPDVTFDLLTASTATQQAVLGVELSDRLAMSSTPSNSPAVGDLVVEGWTETVSDTEWSWAPNASPWAPEQMWVLDDPTYGVLDSTSRVGY